MNMKGLFYPNMRMDSALRESSSESMSRIEITYSAATTEAQEELFSDEFVMRTTIDLGHAQQALNEVEGVAWHIPIKELLEEFLQGARSQQLLIVQPTIAAMIYANNAKSSCYTGFWRTTPPGKVFDFVDFLIT